MQVGVNVTSALDKNQWEGIRDKLQFATQQLEDRINLWTYNFSRVKYGDILSD